MVRSVWNDLIRNWVLFYEEPSYPTLVAGLTDFSSYLVMPLIGGFYKAEARRKYKQDTSIYMDAGITEDYIFLTGQNVIKEKYWELFGLVNRINQAVYDKYVDPYL